MHAYSLKSYIGDIIKGEAETPQLLTLFYECLTIGRNREGEDTYEKIMSHIVLSSRRYVLNDQWHLQDIQTPSLGIALKYGRKQKGNRDT
jgi:hypothetical protein